MTSKNLLKEKVRALPQKPGVYFMKDRLGTIIYVGKAKNLKTRVSSYFQASRKSQVSQPKIAALIDSIYDFSFIEVLSEPEALLLESKAIKENKPKYNTEFVDDKRFLMVQVNMAQELPRFTLTRHRKDRRSQYFGPFPFSGPLKKTLAEIRRKFGVLLNDGNPKKINDNQYVLYTDARNEIYGHPNEVTVEEYRERVIKACEFLDGKSREWLKDLEVEMEKASENLRFEKAAELRDIINALRKTILKTRKFERSIKPQDDPKELLLTLKNILKLPVLPKHIECFDISHISGTFVVASMVQFRNGKPDKNQYRRFKIKHTAGNDDYLSMEEVVGRRYRRLFREKKTLPDLIVIDGGQGQLSSALNAFENIPTEIPMIIGLAKREETIVFADNKMDLNLSIRNPALQCLQQIRDEAHRFANSFNADLRSKRIKESILDDFSGLGDKKKKVLLSHFGSLAKLKKANASDIMKIDGFGDKTATALYNFLH